MTLAFGTLRSRDDMTASETVPRTRGGSSSVPAPRILPRAVLDAELERQAILADAARRAEDLLKKAHAELGSLREQVLAEAREEAATELATKVLALSEREAAADHRALDRSIELSRLLAERLLGETLALEPSRVVELAETALAEARGARRIEIIAHPDDATALQRAMAQGRLEHVTRVVESAEQARGALRFESEIGVLDAEIAPRLDRLVQRLREGFRHER